MCGIVGRVNRDPQRLVSEREMREALSLLAHRGPDGEGLVPLGRVAIGHRRLAIVDVEHGAQPMFNEDGRVAVTFNGEIYNHAALREELVASGHSFKTRCDAEVLVHGYEEWGEELPRRLVGMFAFAIWDGRREQLLLVRDRFGVKPLYYATPKDSLVFASEAKALFAFADVPRELLSQALPVYFGLRYVPGPRTLFRGIFKLEPGTMLVFKDGAMRSLRYWEPPLELPLKNVEPVERSEELLARLQKSVRMRLLGEVPIGAFLSGGIDSSAVVWAMSQKVGQVRTFSVGFEGDPSGEMEAARGVAKLIGTYHREQRLDADDFLAAMPEVAWHMDEPLGDAASIPLFVLARRAKQEVTVVLSGEGADEVFGGYPGYRKMLLLDMFFRSAPPGVRELGRLSSKMVGAPKLRRYLELTGRPLEHRYLGVSRALSDELVEQVFGEEGLAELWGVARLHYDRSAGLDGLLRMQFLDQCVWLPDDILLKADKMTMAFGLELRVPFLDHELVEAMASVPRSWRVGLSSSKRLLRAAMAGRLPSEVTQRQKKGFPVPTSGWLRGPLYGACREMLLASRSCVRSVLPLNLIERFLDEHRRGAADRTEELFTLFAYEHWGKAFFGAEARARLVSAQRQMTPRALRAVATARAS